MIFLVVVYSLATLGLVVAISFIIVAVISLWFNIKFTVGNKKDGKD